MRIDFRTLFTSNKDSLPKKSLSVPYLERFSVRSDGVIVRVILVTGLTNNSPLLISLTVGSKSAAIATVRGLLKHTKYGHYVLLFASFSYTVEPVHNDNCI